MKPIYFLFKFSLCLFSILSLSTSFAKCSQEYLAGFEEFPPFFITKDNKLVGGFDKDFADLVKKHYPCEIKFQLTPWKRLLNEVKKGRMHFVFSALPTESRLKWAYATPIYSKVNQLLFINKKVAAKYNIKEVSDFKKLNKTLRIGIVRGWEYNEKVTILNDSFINKSELVSDLKVLQMIDRNRVSAAILNDIGSNYQIKKYGLKNLVSFDGNFGTEEYSILVSKEVGKVEFDRFNKAIEKVLKSREYKKLLIKYFN